MLMFCLIKKTIRDAMKRIQGKLHKIGTCNISNISLSCFDDNRVILDDGNNSLTYFHKNAKNQ